MGSDMGKFELWKIARRMPNGYSQAFLIFAVTYSRPECSIYSLNGIPHSKFGSVVHRVEFVW